MGQPPKGGPKAPPEPEKARFKFKGREYDIADIDDLEFGELEEIEDAFGLPAEEIDWRRAKATRWLLYLSLRRAGVTVKFEDLAEVRFSDVEDGDDPDRPTEDGAPAAD